MKTYLVRHEDEQVIMALVWAKNEVDLFNAIDEHITPSVCEVLDVTASSGSVFFSEGDQFDPLKFTPDADGGELSETMVSPSFGERQSEALNEGKWRRPMSFEDYAKALSKGRHDAGEGK